jgi:ketosteroid isomerase-like protein
MRVEENRALALRMVASLGGGKPDQSLFHPQAEWWVPGQGWFPNDKFLAFAEAFTDKLVGNRSNLTVEGVTAEGDRVAIEAVSHGQMTNGKIYNNTYHYLFVFEDGKIRKAKLYNDTLHAAEVQKS